MQVLKTKEFVKDVNMAKDPILGVAVTSRIERLLYGNFGDTKSVGDGVSELRIHYGAGYRMYYSMRGKEIVLLLCAGSKSDQKKDIERAKEINKRTAI